ncbi:phosphotransferase [Nocardiopsis sp. N85]|uniref:phosphotransferase n=1 Tax=Nocardiopsis sp. N85 TaxID=3029400 RepID=UPI00237F4923|nr:phosphotransferase [Nocardiopsis sp. N85]MDE3723107.1 phosphotransferase [Nocardiopsis sp. N85]
MIDVLEAEEDRTVLRSYGTRLLRTTVSRDENGFVWVRRPGPDAPAPFAPARISADPALETAAVEGVGGLRLALGTPVGEGRLYRAFGPDTVAGRLLYGGGGPGLSVHLRGLGAMLRHLHGITPAEGTAALGRPRGLDRLGRWLADPAPERVDAAGRAARERLGDRRWGLLRDWYGELLAAAPALCHGAPGLGSLVPGGEGAAAVLLTGEDLSAGPPVFDLGWTVGELTELAWQMGRGREIWQPLLTALFEGYGDDLGPHWYRWAALRTVLHTHDFSTYTEAAPDLVPKYADFVGHLIDAEAK